MNTTAERLKKCFPGAVLWTRLPALICWIGMSLGIFIASSIIPFTFTIPSRLWGPVIILIIILFCIVILCKNSAVRFVLSLLIGALVFQLKVDTYTSELSLYTPESDRNAAFFGTVVSNPALLNDKFRFQLQVDSMETPSGTISKKHSFICQGVTAPLYGARIVVSGKVFCPVRTKTPFIFNDFEYLFSNDIYGRIQFDSFEVLQPNAADLHALNNVFRSQVLHVIDNFTNTDHRALLRAAFLNESNFLSENLKSIFRKSGTYHLLSISGLHAAMLIAATYFILLLIPINNTIKHCVVLMVIWTYQILIGWLPSLLRATIMASIVIAAFFFQKKNYTLQSIGIAGIVLLVLSPGSLFNPGYQLSFSATVCIIMLYSKFTQYKPSIEIPILQKSVHYLYSSLAVSLCGFIGTAPILAWHFGTLSLFGLFANIAAVFIMSCSMWLFFLCIALQYIVNPAVLPLCDLTSFHFNLLFKIAELSTVVPFSEIVVPVPPIEIVIVFTVTFLIAAAIDTKHLLRYFLVAIPACILFSTISIVLHKLNYSVSIVRITDRFSSYTAIRWPAGNVWVIEDEPGRRKIPKEIIDKWMRQFLYSKYEKVLKIGDSSNILKKASKKYIPADLPETIPQLNISENFTGVILQKGAFKACQCTCKITFNDSIPSLYIVNNQSSLSIPLNGDHSERTAIQLITLDGKKSFSKNF